jgi:hypothetical protein
MQMATIQELAEKLSAVLKPPASERVLYHGTLPSRVDAILKGGLDPHRMGTGVLSGMPEELRVPRIFLTKNKGEAEDWAATGASQDRWEATKGQWLLSRIMNQFKHEPGPVVEARLPANFPVKQQLDLFGGDDEYESEQHIPAKYLRRIDNLAAKMSEYLRHA